ncbi:MAG: MgtC/SapB family protein [Planctomycetes bacterium]|nr:MgtC/SapB family protein [Planctomycetota bacterium]
MDMSQLLAMVTAVFFGGAIGFERALSGKPAGLRTNILVCLGAAVFTSIAQSTSGGSSDASSRVMAGIITGVGFLGAGVLIHEGSGVHGLTTAASVWLVASIGVACGLGMYAVGAAATFMALLVLVVLSPLAKKIRRDLHKKEVGKKKEKEGI